MEKIYGKFVKHKSLYRYNDEMHDFFREYKRNGDVELSNVFSKEIGQMKYFENFDLITYIPSIHSHFKKRQFNPVKELYKQLPLENIFKIIDENDSSQAMKTRTERLKVSQKFQVIKDISEVKKIVIVDDVYTTGRTLNHAREAILNVNSNCEVETFSLAR
ncbi:ComF family protein [Companilactobacillus sp. DQM5]|uniref:ComF family protein n=1 Tax=Companilactobacillus sp. DQM5 TaxID=3463359 RepID=UPI0040595001